ncbi:hypothetical protein EYF80_052314 [Liparis tanakae]|uniref:Uncharacterized protein n=1 Tax=Liparis tanakae TaxID=230148 RepID=A0A4Z2F8H4_9TELE|nr:hypothetical protein EYF80_052314 [Liparis tanakae]
MDLGPRPNWESWKTIEERDSGDQPMNVDPPPSDDWLTAAGNLPRLHAQKKTCYKSGFSDKHTPETRHVDRDATTEDKHVVVENAGSA